jgi:phthalate 4,5-cis-dihydrodiol dehydrogenase
MESMPELDLMAGADVVPETLQRFKQRFPGARTFDSVAAMCADPDVEAIWVASPNRFHAEHAITAAEHGKHVVVEKPMALSIEQAERMLEAADKHGVKLLAGHTRSFTLPVRAMRKVILSGRVGKLQAIHLWSYSDWMLRPRTADELDINQGGGIPYRQGPHQIDTVRLLGGGKLRSVRGMTGQWMPERAIPGYYSAYLEFEDGTPATIAYGGYGYFNTADLVWGIGDRLYSEEQAVQARRAFRAGQADDAAAKEQLRETTRTGRDYTVGRLDVAGGGNWFGILLASCERGMLRQSPAGILVYDDAGHHEVPVQGSGAAGIIELQELHAALTRGVPISHDGRWGLATLEVCLAMLESGRERREIMLTHQCPTPTVHGAPAEP